MKFNPSAQPINDKNNKPLQLSSRTLHADKQQCKQVWKQVTCKHLLYPLPFESLGRTRGSYGKDTCGAVVRKCVIAGV